MTSNWNRSGGTYLRIALLLCRPLLYASVPLVVPSESFAQTSPPPMAYRTDAIGEECEYDYDTWCYITGSWAYVVTPSGTIGYGFQPSSSPDGARLAFAVNTDQWLNLRVANIWVAALTGLDPVQLTHATDGSFLAPAWSPDGRQIAFLHWTTGGTEVGVMNPDGSGMRALTRSAFRTVGTGYGSEVVDHPAWSPDSAQLAFTCEVELGNLDICIINRDGTGLVRLTNDPAVDWSPVWSPDRTRIVFSSERFGGGNTLALMNSDGSGQSPIGPFISGWPGSWSPDGSLIAYTTVEAGYLWECYPLELCPYSFFAIHTTTPDGTALTRVGAGADPAYMLARPGHTSPSPDGTRLPPGTQIVDANGAVWTIERGKILRDGTDTGGLGTIITWCGGQIHVLGEDSYWWRWVPGWMRIGPTDPCGPSVVPPGTSPDLTRLPPATQIVDASGAVWTIDRSRILRNGTDTGGLGTVITWCGGQIHVLGEDSYWWRWVGYWLRIGPSDPCTGGS